MNIIASESFQGRGSYPFYTLVEADHVSLGEFAPDATPAIICQYSEKDIVVFTYENLDIAKTTFCILCDAPGIKDKLA